VELRAALHQIVRHYHVIPYNTNNVVDIYSRAPQVPLTDVYPEFDD
jgi:hypothetical protein